MLNFCTLAVELLKYQSRLVAQNIIVNPEWNYENPQQDTLVITTTAQKHQFRITREKWDRAYEFSLKRNDYQNNSEVHYRMDLLSLDPIVINKPLPMRTIFQNLSIPSFDLQDFGREVFRVILELNQNYINQQNQYYQAIALNLN